MRYRLPLVPLTCNVHPHRGVLHEVDASSWQQHSYRVAADHAQQQHIGYLPWLSAAQPKCSANLLLVGAWPSLSSAEMKSRLACCW